MRRMIFGLRILFLVTIAVLVINACGGESETPPPQQQTPAQEAANSAPPPEEHPVIILYDHPEIGKELSGWAVHRGDTSFAGRHVDYAWLGLDVAIIDAGKTAEDAVASLRFALDAYEPSEVILAGLAFPLDPKLLPGDIVIPHQWLALDSNAKPTDSVQNLSEEFQQVLGVAARSIAFRYRKVDRRLSEIMDSGLAVSGPYEIAESKAKRSKLFKSRGAVIADVSSAQVIAVAHNAGLPTVSVRGCWTDIMPPDEIDDREVNYDEINTAYNVAVTIKMYLEREL